MHQQTHTVDANYAMHSIAHARKPIPNLCISNPSGERENIFARSIWFENAKFNNLHISIYILKKKKKRTKEKFALTLVGNVLSNMHIENWRQHFSSIIIFVRLWFGHFWNAIFQQFHLFVLLMNGLCDQCVCCLIVDQTLLDTFILQMMRRVSVLIVKGGGKHTQIFIKRNFRWKTKNAYLRCNLSGSLLISIGCCICSFSSVSE